MLQVTELILLTSDRVSSMPKTNRKIDHKDPGLIGVVMIWFAGHVVLMLSSMEREGPKCSLYQANSLLSRSIQGQVLHYNSGTLDLGLTGALLPVLPTRLSRRWSGGTTGRTQISVAGWAIAEPCLFSLGPLSILTFSWSASIIDKLFSARNVPSESLPTNLRSRLTNN